MTALQNLSLGAYANDPSAESIRDALTKVDALITAAKAAGWDSNGPARPVVKAATTAALAANTYSAGVLTATSNGALASQDGVSLAAGEKLLVKNEVSALKNGVYVVTQVGDGSSPYILTRSDDYSTWTELVSAIIAVDQGSTQAGFIFQCTSNAGGTLGTTAVDWAPAATSAITAAIFGYLAAMTSFGGSLAALADAAALVAVLRASAANSRDTTNNTTLLTPANMMDLGVGRVLFTLPAANMNSTADQQFTKQGTFSSYLISGFRVGNSSASCVSAVGGVYTAALKGGNAIMAASQSYTSINASGLGQGVAINSIGFSTQTATPYLSLTTPHGSAATLDWFILGWPLP